MSKPLTKSQGTVLAGVLAGVGVAMFAGGSAWAILLPPKYRSSAMGWATPAECDTCDVPVSFRLREPPYNTITTVAKNPGVDFGLRGRQSVVVWYDPSNPSDATLGAPTLLDWRGGALAAVGIVVMVVVCIVYTVWMRRPEAPLEKPFDRLFF